MPSITVPEPVLNPPFTGDTYPDGWLKILGKSAYAVYLAPTVSQEREATFTGVWQPMIAQSGLYQVSAYLGVGEFSDYAAFYANVFPESTGLTRSAMYQINHADGSSTIEIDQSIRDSGWIDLGVFPFEAGANGTVTLTNQTDEADSTAVIALSSLRLTSVMQQETTPTPTETAVPASSPTPASTTEATAVPTTAPEPTTTGETLSLLNFGEPEFASSDIGERDEVEIPLIIDGDPVGRMSISYPVSLESTQADNINANIIVDNEFAEALKVALEDETTSEVVGDVIIRSQFYLTLDAASFDFD
jgi:hypothetical protein